MQNLLSVRVYRLSLKGSRSLRDQYTFWIYFPFSQIYLKSFSSPNRKSPRLSIQAHKQKIPGGILLLCAFKGSLSLHEQYPPWTVCSHSLQTASVRLRALRKVPRTLLEGAQTKNPHRDSFVVRLQGVSLVTRAVSTLDGLFAFAPNRLSAASSPP